MCCRVHVGLNTQHIRTLSPMHPRACPRAALWLAMRVDTAAQHPCVRVYVRTRTHARAGGGRHLCAACRVLGVPCPLHTKRRNPSVPFGSTIGFAGIPGGLRGPCAASRNTAPRQGRGGRRPTSFLPFSTARSAVSAISLPLCCGVHCSPLEPMYCAPHKQAKSHPSGYNPILAPSRGARGCQL